MWRAGFERWEDVRWFLGGGFGFALFLGSAGCGCGCGWVGF